jgi:1-acyl-sn-glycerol-3-phosphate acyltransferase
MIVAKHHSVIYPFFKWFTRRLLKRNFHSIQIESDFEDKAQPVLVLANHISWWDGFWVEYLNQQTIHRRFHFMMLEEQLKKHWYFRYTGGYSVRPKSREMVKSIEYTIGLLKNPANIILLFPQGKIHSAFNDSIHFESGIQQIIHKTDPDFQVLFVANFTDYLSDVKPNLFIYAKAVRSSKLKNGNVEEEYNQFYLQVLNHHKTKISG